MVYFLNNLHSFVNYAIFCELCDRMRFEVDCAKLHHRVISEGLTIDDSKHKGRSMMDVNYPSIMSEFKQGTSRKLSSLVLSCSRKYPENTDVPECICCSSIWFWFNLNFPLFFSMLIYDNEYQTKENPN